MAVGCYQSVCGEDACPAAIGQDRELLANLLVRQRQGLRRVEQLGHRLDPQHAGATKRGVIDGIGASQNAGVRGGGAGAGIRSARLQHQDRLDARCRSRRGHEFPAMGDTFDIEQDGAGVRIRGEIVEHVPEIDIRHIPQ